MNGDVGQSVMRGGIVPLDAVRRVILHHAVGIAVALLCGLPTAGEVGDIQAGEIHIGGAP